MTTLTKPRKKTHTAPPKKWRNRWRAREDIEEIYDEESIIRISGEEWWGSLVHPTKEIAEHLAMKDLEYDKKILRVRLLEYLGAFPVED